MAASNTPPNIATTTPPQDIFSEVAAPGVLGRVGLTAPPLADPAALASALPVVVATAVLAIVLALAVPATKMVEPCESVESVNVAPLSVIGGPPRLNVELPMVKCVWLSAVKV